MKVYFLVMNSKRCTLVTYDKVQLLWFPGCSQGVDSHIKKTDEVLVRNTKTLFCGHGLKCFSELLVLQQHCLLQ